MNTRPANPNDVSLIYSFLKKKAEFDRNIGAFQGILSVTEEKIQKTLFGEIPFSYVLFVENFCNEIGFALYHFRYSSFSGQPSIWIDDLYIDEEQRSQGAGILLMNKLAQIARLNDCSHLAWNADVRNIRGLNFYNKIGAKITKQDENRYFLMWIP